MKPYIPTMNHWFAFKVLTVDARDEESKQTAVIMAPNKKTALERLDYEFGLKALRVKHVFNMASFDSEAGANWQISVWKERS